MSLLTSLRHALLGRPQPKTKIERVEPTVMRIDELPPFTVHTAELMRYDPQVRIGLGARNGLLMAAQVDVIGSDEQVVRWVQHQWDSLWNGAAHELLRAKLYGFLPFEVVYRRAQSGPFAGLIEVERLIDHHPSEARLLVLDDKIVGFSLEEEHELSIDALNAPLPLGEGGRRPGEGLRASNVVRSSYHPHPSPLPEGEGTASSNRPANTPGLTNLFAPRALVCTYDTQCSNPYGCALLARAYPAWFEKWMPGGAKRTLQLRMIKDAYIGDILWYPPDKQVELTDGTKVSWRDLAREVVENRASGGALTLPLLYDSQGNKLVDYTPPRDVRGATPLFRWKADLDLEIWKALEVPPEIIQASTTGSGFSGRWIPFAVALSAVHQELMELVRSVDRDILRPIAHLNFGRVPQYEIRPRSLVETYAEMFGQSEPPVKRRDARSERVRG